MKHLKLGQEIVIAKDDSWLDKKVKNPKTGNKVKVRSLDKEQQEKYRPKKKKKKEDDKSAFKDESTKDNRTARDKLKDDGSPTDFKGPENDSDATSGDAEFDRKTIAKLSKLAQMANEAKKAGKNAPEYNLCEVSVPGTNLFCANNKGIPRAEMPQLKGKAVPGSKAADLEEKDGEVDAEQLFKDRLKEKGIAMNSKTVDAASLKATQTELVGAKVAGMLEALKKDPNHEKITAPIYVSKDGYILDGHHRWAALVGLDMADGKKEPVEMNVIEVDMGAEELVGFTNDFADEVGIAQKKASTKAMLASMTLGSDKSFKNRKKIKASTYNWNNVYKEFKKLTVEYVKRKLKKDSLADDIEDLLMDTDNLNGYVYENLNLNLNEYDPDMGMSLEEIAEEFANESIDPIVDYFLTAYNFEPGYDIQKAKKLLPQLQRTDSKFYQDGEKILKKYVKASIEARTESERKRKKKVYPTPIEDEDEVMDADFNEVSDEEMEEETAKNLKPRDKFRGPGPRW